MTSGWKRRSLGLLLAAGACRATTGRPSFIPFPEAEHAEVGFDLADEDQTVLMVTDTVAQRLAADSIPVQRIKRFDGFVESRWFDAKTKRPWVGRPLGPDAVKVRAWVDPAKPGFSRVEIETVYIPKVDPSLPARENEIPVPTEHAINRQMGEMLKDLGEAYGPPKDEQTPAEAAAAGDRPAAAAPARGTPRPVASDTARRAAADTASRGPAQPTPKPPTPAPPPPPPPPPPPAPPGA